MSDRVFGVRVLVGVGSRRGPCAVWRRLCSVRSAPPLWKLVLDFRKIFSSLSIV